MGEFLKIERKRSILRGEQFRASWTREFSGGGELGCLFVQDLSVFLTQPLMTVAGVVASSLLILLDKPGVVHGAKLADEDGFGFLVQFGGECHGSETMSIGFRRVTMISL